MAMGRGVATGNDDPNSDDENEHNDPDGKDFIQCSGDSKAPDLQAMLHLFQDHLVERILIIVVFAIRRVSLKGQTA